MDDIRKFQHSQGKLKKRYPIQCSMINCLAVPILIMSRKQVTIYEGKLSHLMQIGILSAGMIEKAPLILFLDESGDHVLQKINPEYPIFGLGGAIIDKEHYYQDVVPRTEDFKLRIFGTKDIILHSSKIAKQKENFVCLRNKELWEKFNLEFEKLLTGCDLTVISTVIKKDEHIARYKNPYCPYEYSLEIVMECFAKILYRGKRIGYIIAESRGKKEDRELLEAYESITKGGTRYMHPRQINERIKGFSFKKKSSNIVGLQLSDLCISCITAAVLNNNYERKDYRIVKEKMDKWHGLKIRPSKNK